MARPRVSVKATVPVGAAIALAIVTFGLGATSTDAMFRPSGKLEPIGGGMAKVVPNAPEQQSTNPATPNLVVAGGGKSADEIAADPTIARKFVLPEPVVEPQDAQVEMVLAGKGFFAWRP